MWGWRGGGGLSACLGHHQARRDERRGGGDGEPLDELLRGAGEGNAALRVERGPRNAAVVRPLKGPALGPAVRLISGDDAVVGHRDAAVLRVVLVLQFVVAVAVGVRDPLRARVAVERRRRALLVVYLAAVHGTVPVWS